MWLFVCLSNKECADYTKKLKRQNEKRNQHLTTFPPHRKKDQQFLQRFLLRFCKNKHSMEIIPFLRLKGSTKKVKKKLSYFI